MEGLTMNVESLNLTTSRGATTAYVARPDTEARAGVVLIQEWWGINDHIRDIAGRYANEGYLCIAPQVVTDETFARDVLNASSSLPVLVDAWAAWCGPCRIIAPLLDQLADESGGRYKIAKLNVDKNPRTAATFNIRSIPTLLIFKNGQVVDQIVGAQPKQTIAARLREHVAETRP